MPLYLIVPDRDPLLDSLQYLCHQPLIPLCKAAILDATWGDPGPLFDSTRLPIEPYFNYFESQCRASLSTWSKYDITQLTFQHVIGVLKMVLQSRSRDDMEEFLGGELRGRGDCLTIVGEVVDLTVRLVAMVPIWSFWQGVDGGKGVGGMTTLTWTDGSVQGAFGRHFKGRGDSGNRGAKVELEKTFTARNIEHLGHMKVVWTANLLDHLVVRDEECRTVSIFHHASFLHYQTKSNIYPEGLIDETLRTISLLLPANDPDSKYWFAFHPIEKHLDPQASCQRHLSKEERNIDRFDFWRDRLVTLKQHYDSMSTTRSKSITRLLPPKCLSLFNLNSKDTK